MKLKKVIGIVSYLPEDDLRRQKRMKRMRGLFTRISNLLPGIDILVVSQNWKDFLPIASNNTIIRVGYSKPLGILNARNILREEFLKREYDYLIMFDDDAIPEEKIDGSVKNYLSKMDEHPNGFAFIRDQNSQDSINPYMLSQLNFCAISRYIYEREPLPQVDPQKNEGFEDRLFSTLLHNKYSELEFVPPKGVWSAHFKNTHINMYGGEVPSTWCGLDGADWRIPLSKTNDMDRYIFENKDLPPHLQEKRTILLKK